MAKKANKQKGIEETEFAQNRRAAEDATEIAGAHQSAYLEKKRIYDLISGYLGEERANKVDLSRPEAYYPLLAEVEKLARDKSIEDFKVNRTSILRNAKPESLERIAGAIPPRPSLKQTNRKTYDAHQNYRELVEMVGAIQESLQNPDERQREEVQGKVLEKYLKREDELSEDEIVSQLEKKKPFQRLSADKKKIWVQGIRAAYMASLKETYARQPGRFIKDLEDDLKKAEKNLYACFANGKKNYKLADYVDANLEAFSEQGPRELERAADIVYRLAAYRDLERAADRGYRLAA